MLNNENLHSLTVALLLRFYFEFINAHDVQIWMVNVADEDRYLLVNNRDITGDILTSSMAPRVIVYFVCGICIEGKKMYVHNLW